jgi:hypothetical protein
MGPLSSQRSVSAGAFNRRLGNRRASVSIAIRASTRASGAPTQWWLPCPKLR